MMTGILVSLLCRVGVTMAATTLSFVSPGAKLIPGDRLVK
jgi:hypothetical protein